MWKYVGEGECIPGVPARDMTDEEFEEACARYAEKELEEDRAAAAAALKASPLYRHEGASGRGARPTSAAPADE